MICEMVPRLRVWMRVVVAGMVLLILVSCRLETLDQPVPRTDSQEVAVVCEGTPRDGERVEPPEEEAASQEATSRVSEGPALPESPTRPLAKPSPPDLSQCVRMEVGYTPSTLLHLFRTDVMRGVLSPEELGYVQSVKTVTVTDPGVIEELARDISTANPIRLPGIPNVRPVINFTCYNADRTSIRFTTFGRLIMTPDRQWFTCDDPPRQYYIRGVLHALVSRGRCAENISRLRLFLSLYLERATVSGTDVAICKTWCDALLSGKSPRSQRETRGKLSHDGKAEGKSYYAMNANYEPNSPADMVMLFETEAGWNRCGGPELFSFSNHDARGGCVALNDGTVKFIRTEEELHALRWR